MHISDACIKGRAGRISKFLNQVLTLSIATEWLTDDNADEKGRVGRFGAELTLEKFGHKRGKDGEKESFRRLIKSQAHERRIT